MYTQRFYSSFPQQTDHFSKNYNIPGLGWVAFSASMNGFNFFQTEQQGKFDCPAFAQTILERIVTLSRRNKISTFVFMETRKKPQNSFPKTNSVLS